MNYKMIRFVISWVLKVEGMLVSHPGMGSRYPLGGSCRKALV